MIYLSTIDNLDHLVPHLPSLDVVRDMPTDSTDPTQVTCPMIDRADCTAPAGQT